MPISALRRRSRGWRRTMPRDRCRSGCGRWSECRCRCGRLIRERAHEFAYAASIDTGKSTCGDVHSIFALYQRRRIEMEYYETSSDLRVVRRDSINREGARLDTVKNKITHVHGKISHFSRDGAVTGRVGTTHFTRWFTGRRRGCLAKRGRRRCSCRRCGGGRRRR